MKTKRRKLWLDPRQPSTSQSQENIQEEKIATGDEKMDLLRENKER